jgi:hypothetical protein
MVRTTPRSAPSPARGEGFFVRPRAVAGVPSGIPPRCLRRTISRSSRCAPTGRTTAPQRGSGGVGVGVIPVGSCAPHPRRSTHARIAWMRLSRITVAANTRIDVAYLDKRIRAYDLGRVVRPTQQLLLMYRRRVSPFVVDLERCSNRSPSTPFAVVAGGGRRPDGGRTCLETTAFCPVCGIFLFVAGEIGPFCNPFYCGSARKSSKSTRCGPMSRRIR